MANDIHPYQREGIASVLAELAEHESTMLVLPTGTGKTRCLAHIAEAFVPRGPVLVLTNRRGLVRQIEEEFRRWTSLDVAIEMGKLTCSSAGKRHQVVIASVNSMAQPERLAAYGPDAFSLVITDEGHHSIADIYQRIYGFFRSKRLLCTATPDRFDGRNLGEVCESVAYVYELSDAIRDGYLVPIRQKRVYVDSLDFSQVRRSGGDFDDRELEQIMLEERHLHAVVAPVLEHVGKRKTLIFAAGVDHAYALEAVLNRSVPLGGKPIAVALHGEVQEKVQQATLAAFKAGEFQFLIGCDLFLEGFNETSIECVVAARPTQSRALHTQMVGRGTRLHPGKVDLLVLDFVGNSKHMLVSTIDLIDPELDERVRDAAQRRVEDGEEVLKAIDAAREEIEEEDRRRHELAVMEARRKPIQARSRSRLEDVVPEVFDLFAFNPKTAPRNGVPRTAAQSSALYAYGFTLREFAKLDRAQADALIAKAKARADAHLCDREQARYLARHLIDARGLSERSARTLIAAIEKNPHWKAPKRPQVRQPGQTR